MSRRPRRRPPRSKLALRWAAVGALALVAFFYYRPLHSYFSTRDALAQRSAQVAQLRREHRKLVRRLADSTSTEALERQARRLGFVKPGEQLFIVKGIRSWLRRHAPSRLRSRGG
jgi:cell division protein FtsB